MLSLDADSKVVLIEREPGKKPKRHNTTQVKSYYEDQSEVAANFILSLSKAIASYRDVYDGGPRYSLATHGSKLNAGQLNNSAEHSLSLNKYTLIPNNIIQLEGPLQDSICPHLTEVIQQGTRTPETRE